MKEDLTLGLVVIPLSPEVINVGLGISTDLVLEARAVLEGQSCADTLCALHGWMDIQVSVELLESGYLALGHLDVDTSHNGPGEQKMRGWGAVLLVGCRSKPRGSFQKF